MQTSDHQMTEAGQLVGAFRPNSARIWDALMGGRDNYAADREVIERLWGSGLGLRQLAYQSKAFRVDAVKQLVAAGVTQFIDCGPGLVEFGAMTSEVAQGLKPDVRVAYVDLDPVVLTHARTLEDDHSGRRTRVIEADIFDPKSLLSRRDIEDFLDWGRPVALIQTMTLGHCPDDMPAKVMATYMETLPAGSYSVISHCAAPDGQEPQVELLQKPLFGEVFGDHWFRQLAEIERLFTGQHLVRSGVIGGADWLEGTEQWTEYWREFVVAGIGCTTVAGAERVSSQLAAAPVGPPHRRRGRTR